MYGLVYCYCIEWLFVECWCVCGVSDCVVVLFCFVFVYEYCFGIVVGRDWVVDGVVVLVCELCVVMVGGRWYDCVVLLDYLCDWFWVVVVFWFVGVVGVVGFCYLNDIVFVVCRYRILW